jgi:hypothetical protein
VTIYTKGMRYADGGGLNAKGRARREEREPSERVAALDYPDAHHALAGQAVA